MNSPSGTKPDWQPAADLFPGLAVGDWFEMEHAPYNRFMKRDRTTADRWGISAGAEKICWCWQGMTSMTAHNLRAADSECRIRQAEPIASLL